MQASGFLTLRSPADPGGKKGKKEGLREGVCCERGGWRGFKTESAERGEAGTGTRGEKIRGKGGRRKSWRAVKRGGGNPRQLSRRDFPHFIQMGKPRLREVKRLVQGPSHRHRAAEQGSAGPSLPPLNCTHLNKTGGGRTTGAGREAGGREGGQVQGRRCYHAT